MIENKIDKSEEEVESFNFKSHWYRYVTLIVYLINQTWFGTFNTAYTPLKKSLMIIFDLSETMIISSSSIFLVGNILPAPFVYSIIKKLGLTKSIILCNVICVLGSFSRIFIENSFYFVLLGQFLMGVGACFIVNTTIQFCYNWFHPTTRPLFLAIISFMNIVGGGLGNSVPIIFVDEKSSFNTIHSQIHQYNFYSMVFCFGVFLLNLFFFKGKPPKGFGHIDERQKTKDKTAETHFLRESFAYIKKLIKNPLFRTYFIIYNLSNTAVVVLSTIINIIVEEFGYDTVN